METLKFIAEFLVDSNVKGAALRSGIPETYASRQGQWLKKHPMVIAAIEKDLDAAEIRQLQKSISKINAEMEICKKPSRSRGTRLMSKIYIDADGCPVKEEVYKVADRYKMNVVLVANKKLNLPLNPLFGNGGRFWKFRCC